MNKDLGASPDGDRATAVEPVPVSPLRDGIPSAWTEEPDGSAIGYMCLTDWEYEIANASGGNVVYPSLTDIKRRRPCVEGCGIVEVRVSCIRVVEPSRDDERMRADLAPEAGA